MNEEPPCFCDLLISVSLLRFIAALIFDEKLIVASPNQVDSGGIDRLIYIKHEMLTCRVNGGSIFHKICVVRAYRVVHLQYFISIILNCNK